MTIAKKADYLVVPNITFNYCFELLFETASIKAKFSLTGQAFLALFFSFFLFFFILHPSLDENCSKKTERNNVFYLFMHILSDQA
jgi:hypothetical protein